MDKSRFFYHLPKERIAQTPAEPRDHSRLLAVNRATGEIRQLRFYDVVSLLREGDLLVINDSRVIPARLPGKKAESDIAAETLLLRDLGQNRWETIVKPGRRLKEGAVIEYGAGGEIRGTVEEVMENGNRVIFFEWGGEESFYALLDRIGQMPLPHYITAPLQSRESYQTVYAKHPGSAAAPTAGFHFTETLLETIRAKGIGIAKVTLHVGLGTFRPVKEEQIENHLMHREYYSISGDTAAAIERTKAGGGRVIAVGTTSCRTLEASAKKHGRVVPGEDSTDIFIYPGCEFRVIDGLITNFHLPESTLIMLVSAFLGHEETMRLYDLAVAEKYRFYSFGDAMIIL